MKRNARRERTFSYIIRLVFLIVVLGGTGFAVHKIMQRTEAEALTKIGYEKYLEAYRIVTYGQGKRAASGSDPEALYRGAYEDFSQAASLDSGNFDAHFMLTKLAPMLLEWGSTARNKITTQQLKSYQAQGARSKAALKKMDPSGEKTTKKDQELKQKMQGAG